MIILQPEIKMKIKINENNRPSKISEKSLSEFTDTEIESIFPASDLLNRINFDHVYSTSGSSRTQRKFEPKESKSLPSVGRIHRDRLHGSSTQSWSASWSDTWADDIYEDVSSDESLTDVSSMSLNANSIQQVFERMIDLTSLDTIANQSSDQKAADDNVKNKEALKKVMFVDELPGTSESSPVTSTHLVSSRNKHNEVAAMKLDSKTTSKKSKKSTKAHKANESPCQIKSSKEQNKSKKTNQSKSSVQTQCKDFDKKYAGNSVDKGNRTTADKYAEAEHEMNKLLICTAELLVRRWGEYLCMSTEKIRTFEIENAKQQRMVEDVVEMLENKDLYVWQLIEDLHFF